MEIVIDSHALFWFLTGNTKLSLRAQEAIEQADKVLVPSIVLMEILYILEKNNLETKFVDILKALRLKKYIIYPLDVEVITQTLFIPKVEMHDRIIIATARTCHAALVSKDKTIQRVYLNTIW